MAKKLQLYRNDNILKSREAAVNALTAELSARQNDGEFIAMRYFHNVAIVTPKEIMPIEDEVVTPEDSTVESGETSAVTSGETTERIIKTIFGCGAIDTESGKYHVTIIDLEDIENSMNNMDSQFKEALAELHQQINDEIKVALDKEIEDRIDGDNNLASALQKEVEDRTNADNEIKGIIMDNERVIAESLSEIVDSVGLTENFKYVAHTNDLYLSAATTHSNADLKLSQGLKKEVEDRLASEEELREYMDGLANDARVFSIQEIEPVSANVRTSYQLVDQDGKVSGDTINIYNDSALKDVELVDQDGDGNLGQFLKFTYITDEAKDKVVYLNVSLFLIEAEFGNGLQVSAEGVVSLKINTSSDEGYLSVDENGIKVTGIKNDLNGLKDTIDSEIKTKLEDLEKTIKNSTLSAITVNDKVGEVDDKNMATVVIDGSDIKLSTQYVAATYPTSGTATAFTPVASAAKIDDAVKQVDSNVSLLVEEVIYNEKTIAEALSVIRKSVGLDVNGEYIASQLGGLLSNTTSVVSALASMATKIVDLEARIEALESQL